MLQNVGLDFCAPPVMKTGLWWRLDRIGPGSNWQRTHHWFDERSRIDGSTQRTQHWSKPLI